jgi:hypothetical protein
VHADRASIVQATDMEKGSTKAWWPLLSSYAAADRSLNLTKSMVKKQTTAQRLGTTAERDYLTLQTGATNGPHASAVD